MKKVLITGGAGFFGEILRDAVLARGFDVVSIDLERNDFVHPHYEGIQGDIRDAAAMESIFSRHTFDAVFHCAAILAHAVQDTNFLWSCNVEGTRSVAEFAKKYRVPKVVFTSSNCLWGEGFGRPVREDDQPKPVEIYGKSKWEGEKILMEYANDFDAIIFRCPTIIDSGRLGLLAILFEFIDEGRKVWVVGGGRNVYQFIYAKDLAEAFILATDYQGSDVFNIGSDNVKSFTEVYEYVVKRANTGARVRSLPRGPTILLMKIAYALGLSPLGPYQYKMIAESFQFDTSKIKAKLHWHPTMTNEDMLWKSYEHYHAHRDEIENRKGVSAHKQAAKMGIIRLLKWLS